MTKYVMSQHVIAYIDMTLYVIVCHDDIPYNVITHFVITHILHNRPTSAAFMPTNEKRVAPTNIHFFRWPKRIPAYERRECTIKINSSWPTTTQRPLEIFPHPLSSFFPLLSLLFPHPQRILSVFLSVLSLSLSSSYILYHNDSNYSPSTGPSCCFYCCKFYCKVAGVKSFISLKEEEKKKPEM